VQFMTVKPGFYGSPFEKSVLEPLEMFSMAHPNVPIAVDGGITPETAPLARKAGAAILVCGSYILESSDIPKAIQSLST
ncbi:MAG: ribulose-phosphate 3-epimerase, partial [Candidatus Yanofskybacteria bacterium]|nr:ribulose-phosphate 3-epimerase [Candidatus Yanofskybacteria bacterium]